MDVKLGEKSIGQHGSNVYYKEFSVSTADSTKQYRLGKFYFVQKSGKYPVTIAEFQLIWHNIVSKRNFASVKLYFNKPDSDYEEENDQQEEFGKDEVVEATKQVVIECSKFFLWECSHKNWDSTVGESLYHNIEVNKLQKLLEKTTKNTNDEENFDVKVLSFPQYCRYRACLKMLRAGIPKTYHDLLACGGLDIKNLNTVVLFSRRQFEHEDIEDLSLTEDIKVPVFKGRPRKRKKQIPPVSNKKIKISQASLPPRKAEAQKGGAKTNNGKVIIPVMPALNKKNQHKIMLGIKPKRQVRGRDTIVKLQIDHENREKNVQFSIDLHKFMEERGMPIVKIPSIGCAQVEPLILYNAVKKHGGYGQVTLNKLWRDVYDCLGHSTMITNAATGTRKIYEKLLLPYEKYQRGKAKEKEKNKDASAANAKETTTTTTTMISTPGVKSGVKPYPSISKEGQAHNIHTNNNNATPITTSKYRGRTSTKFNKQIEKLRNKQTRKLEEARLINKTARTSGKKPPWVNELNVDIVNSRRKSDAQMISSIPDKRSESERISVEDDIVSSQRRAEMHSPIKTISPRVYSSSRDSVESQSQNAQKLNFEAAKNNITQPQQPHATSQQQRMQRGGGNLCEFKIQSVRSLATPDRRPIPKTTQYLHYPFPPSSSYQYVPPPAASRQYFTLNETNTLIPITQQYGAASYPFREMRAFRQDHLQPTESNSYKIKSSALKNHEPYIIHHPTHVNRAYHSELPSHYPVVYTHHPRYVTAKASTVNDIPANVRRNLPPPGGQQKARYAATNKLTNCAPNASYVEHVPMRPHSNAKVENTVEVPTQHVVEGYPAVCVVTEPMHVLPKHKWSTSVSCNI